MQDKLRALFGAREAPWIDVDFSDWSNLHRGLFLDPVSYTHLTLPTIA